MRLAELADLGHIRQGNPAAEISGLAYDSRRVAPGHLFIAVPGFRADGHDFIPDALRRGATAVVVERPVALPADVAVLEVASARRAMPAIAARFHGFPSRRMRVIGVTGTNGKTTTTHLIRAILMEQGQRVGLLGTVHNYIGDQVLPVEHTTPEAADLQELLAQMAAAGSDAAVMEVSSHALELHRVDDVEFDVAVFTNLTQDHLDFHGDLTAYREAKGKLFANLGAAAVKPGPRAAVLNADDPASTRYRELSRVPVITYGLAAPADVTARDITITPRGAGFTLVTPQGELPMQLKLTGRFNVYNSLAAVCAGLTEGISLDIIRRALERTSGVAGRLEAVEAGQPFGVFVDYAHTPDGLENVLAAARGFTGGRVIAVFGCGGDRDRTKRPQMGRIAAELADYAIITSDNPRSEEPAAIVQEVAAGFAERRPDPAAYELVVDRADAIARAVALARAEDVVVIAGKGHETYQIFRDRTIHFDDREVARAAIAGVLARGAG